MQNQVDDNPRSTVVKMGDRTVTFLERSAAQGFATMEFLRDFEKMELSFADAKIIINSTNASVISNSIFRWADTLPFYERWFIKRRFTRRKILKAYTETQIAKWSEIIGEWEGMKVEQHVDDPTKKKPKRKKK